MAGASSGTSSPATLPEEDEVVAEQRAIQRLPEHVVNKIAAGEIIHRPANAIKEMMENSLDAGATMIRVQLKEGGLKMLQIQDDGSGVSPTDMPLLCERFATSKLKDFSDLSRMSTFGFRGEALASISYVSASMIVLSKTHSSEVAYKAYYASGHLAPPKPGQSSSPKPCAGAQGTTITVEDLFYNVPQRRRALKSAADEYNLALEVMSKYAVHYGGRGIGFTCKKASANVVDLSIPSSPQTSTIDAISLIYGNAVAKELQEIPSQEHSNLGCTFQGWVSGPNWSAKRSQFLCFINNRLVDCIALKRSLLALYTTLLPRGGHPWIYLSIDLDPEKVDVNVHPTKREVHFLDEDEIVEVICNRVQDLLANVNTSRNFRMTQAVLSSSIVAPENTSAASAAPSSLSLSTSQRTVPASSRPGYPQHMVRVDGKVRTLDAMSGFGGEDRSASRSTSRGEEREEEEESSSRPSVPTISSSTEESKTSLRSVFELREEVKRKRHYGMTSILEDYILVGIVDTSKGLALIQHSTKLYLVHYLGLLEEAAYQSILHRFGALPVINLSTPLPLGDLISAALILEADSEQDRQTLGLSNELIVEKVCKRLLKHAEMLQDYFSLCIDERSKCLLGVPNILSSSPSVSSSSRTLLQVERLPTMLLRLATQVDWTNEKACFRGIMQEFAFAHRPLPLQAVSPLSEREVDEKHSTESMERDWKAGWSALLRVMIPNAILAQHAITEVASLPSLYSVFERC